MDHSAAAAAIILRAISGCMNNLMEMISALEKEERGPLLERQRMEWAKIVETHGQTDLFSRHLRMPIESFTRLLELIRPSLEPNVEMASMRGGAIIPELRLCCALLSLGTIHQWNPKILARISSPSIPITLLSRENHHN